MGTPRVPPEPTHHDGPLGFHALLGRVPRLEGAVREQIFILCPGPLHAAMSLFDKLILNGRGEVRVLEVVVRLDMFELAGLVYLRRESALVIKGLFLVNLIRGQGARTVQALMHVQVFLLHVLFPLSAVRFPSRVSSRLDPRSGTALRNLGCARMRRAPTLRDLGLERAVGISLPPELLSQFHPTLRVADRKTRYDVLLRFSPEAVIRVHQDLRVGNLKIATLAAESC